MFLNEDAFNMEGDGDEGRPMGASKLSRRPAGQPPAQPIRPVSANTFNGAQRPGTGGGRPQPRPPSARTYHTDLFDEENDDGGAGAGGDVLAGNNSISAAQKLQQRRELAAQKRRERQLAAGTVTRNPAAGAPGAHQTRPRPPSGGGSMPPPSAAVGANPYSTPRANPLFSGQPVGGMQQNPLAAMNGALNQPSSTMNQPPPSAPPPAFDRHTMAMYAERRSFNISGDGHGAAQQRVPDGRVRGFDEPEADFGVGNRRQRQAPEPEGVAELRRDLEAHGLADEFDPNEGRHPMEVAAERERLKRIEAAAKLGPKAKRIAERPKAARVDASDKRIFLTQPGPEDAPVQCHIVRRVNKSRFLPGGNYPEYFLYLDGPGAKPGDPTNEAKFLLSARKRKKSKSSNYVISLDEEDMARQSGNFFAKLRSNFVGTEFTIYDKGAKPGEKPDGKSAGLAPREDLGAVTYEYNVLGTRGPRKMKGFIPRVSGAASGERARFVATTRDGAHGILDCHKHGRRDDMIVLTNKSPRWNEQMQAYCLNFNGRVTHASVKNFQLVDESDEDERVVLQFGKVGKDMFTMDFQWPMSALQAFAICLTSFDSKLACE